MERIDGVGLYVVRYALVSVVCAGIGTVGLGVVRVLGRRWRRWRGGRGGRGGRKRRMGGGRKRKDSGTEEI